MKKTVFGVCAASALLGACSSIVAGEASQVPRQSVTTVVSSRAPENPGESTASSGTLRSVGTTSVVPNIGGVTEIIACPIQRLRYSPIPALPAGGYTDVVINDSTHTAVAVLKNWPATAVLTNKLLTNISTNVSMSDESASGSVATFFSANHSKKKYVIDFMKWRGEPLTDTNGKHIGWARVGAGLRLIVDIKKDDGSASGNLFALAASVKAGKVDGSISTELIGVDAPEFTQAMPFTIDLSEGNIQKVVEALAVVKTKLYDKNTLLKPNLIARIECDVQESSQSK